MTPSISTIQRLLRKSPVLTILLAELAGTSLWFSGTHAIEELKAESDSAWGHVLWLQIGITLAVQAGFICGTFLFAVTGLADRLASHRIFFVSAAIGAMWNYLFVSFYQISELVLLCRFCTGFALAGIYPIGMKLIITWEPDKKAIVLSFLVGSLTLGTAIPYLIRGLGDHSWKIASLGASWLALGGGLCILALGEGKTIPGRSKFHIHKIAYCFRQEKYRCSALAYFGHMWELYTFWALIPRLVGVLLADTTNQHPATIALFSSGFISAGALACFLNRYLNRRMGTAQLASIWLAISASGCLLGPFLSDLPIGIAWTILFFWSMAVVADSPLFSALSAQAIPADTLGTALTIQNAIGFAITLISLQSILSCWSEMNLWVYWFLLPGPLFGIWNLKRLLKNATSESTAPS